MYRGSRPHRGAFPPASRGYGPRGPPPATGHFFPRAPYWDDHGRSRNGFPRDYHGPPEQHRRSPPRRRYPSPGREDSRGDGPTSRDYGRRYSPSPPRGGLPVDHSLVITVGNELNNMSRDYPSRSSYDGHGARSRSCSTERTRSKSRPRSRSRSRSRGRAVSRSRALSRGRSKSRHCSRSRSRSRSRGQSRARSRARSKSRARSRSHSRSRSKSRNRGRSRARSREQGRSRSSSSSSSYNRREDFRELEMARRRKELEHMLTMPTKSILKKRVGSSETDSPMMVQTSNSPQGHSGSDLSQEAKQLLSAMTKNMDPELLATTLSQSSNSDAINELLSKLQPAKESGCEFSQPHERGCQDSADLGQLLSVMAEAVAQPTDKKKRFEDIEDEEKFLYGDEEEEDKFSAKGLTKAGQSSLLDVCGETGADVQRSDYGTSSYGCGGSVEDEELYTKQLEKHIKEEGADYPPGVGPNDAKDREKVEEYEKIQDLLKTIGLDLGVAEISKMAARTQERLHGMKPAKKPPARRQSKWKHRSRSRSYSSTSSSSGSRSRGHSSSRSNSSRSRSSSCSHSCSRSSSRERISNRSTKQVVHPERRSSQSGSHSQTEVRSVSKAGESSWTKPQTSDVVSPGTTAATFPALPSHHASPYPQPHQPRVMPPNFHPPAYNPYGNYVPYMPQGWPMYPPPVPPQSPLDDFKSTAIERPYLKVIDTGANNGGKMEKKGSKVETLQSSSQNQRRVVEKNNASQKQKVLQELQKLKMDRETRQKKKDRLIKELETLRKQQGELLRKKRREKDGHKDPILMELGRLQEDVMEQISFLRNEHEAAEKKHDELIKVATILGLDHKKIQITVEREHSPAQSRCKETDRSPEKPKAAAATTPSANNKSTKTPVPTSDAQIPDTSAELFEYYDAGNHWCKNCNSTSGSMFDFFTHLHSKTHRKSLDPYDRPWAEKSEKSEKKHSKAEPISKPAKGSEFLIPVRGFYCQLCEDFFGDPICAEAHVTSYAHNEKYKKQMFENPLYEQRRNLDRQAGMESERKQADLKRKRDGGDSPEDQKKSAKDDVRNFKGKDDVDRIKHSKEEPKAKNIRKEENKPKSLKEECERTRYKKEEEDSSRYAREEEEERNKYRKDEEEKYRHRRDEEDRYSRYDEGRYRYKYKEDDRYRYKKEDERYKHGRDDEKKSKYGREAEEGKIKYREEDGVKWPKSKWEEEEEERTTYEKKDKWQRQKDAPSRHKDEKEAAPAKDGKTEPEKPSEPPKVMCGPNPAIFAKLRKKSEDSTVRPSFGKFNWKKPEKTALEKEAEKIAAQFIKEDEAAAAQDDATDADAFAKSVAAAKSIAIKLSGKTAIPPSNEWLAFNQNLSPKPRPSLPPPPPTNILRKTNIGVQSKSVPLNPITSEDSNATAKAKTEMKEPVLSGNLSSRAFVGEEVQLNPVSGDSTDPTPTTTSKSTPVPPPSPIEKEVVTVQPTPSVECVVSLKSDVAAPGVPEEEQNLTVLVRPPPQPKSQAKASDSLKSNKPKPTLAAAKAKDLFDIFYSGSSMMAGTSVGKKTAPETDSGTQACTQAEASQQVQDHDAKDSNDLKESNCQEQPMTPATTCEQPAEEELYSSSGTQADKDTETLEMTKSEEISENMEGLGYSTEVNTLECEVNSEILENIVIMETSVNQDEENPLNPEEVLTVSFSPPPGSFTEQINLDTFEFSFEPL